MGLLAAAAATVVPPGNRIPSSPPSPAARPSAPRPARPRYEAKYRKVYALLKNDSKLRSKIKQAAAAYGIDPMHIVGAIVGEHTYNVDAYDRLQTYYVKAVSYLSNRSRFSYDGEDIDRLRGAAANLPRCDGAKRQLRSVDLPRSRVGQRSFRGKKVGGIDFPNDRFSATFFQPSMPARLSASASSTR